MNGTVRKHLGGVRGGLGERLDIATRIKSAEITALGAGKIATSHQKQSKIV
jgi:hypothetical protein